MEQFFFIKVLVFLFCAVQSNQVKQPRISAIDNSLMITLPEGKHLSIQAEKFLVNELNIIETLNKAQKVDEVLTIYKNYIEGFSSQIKTFESRLNESFNVSNQTSYTELPVAITTRLQRFNRRITNLARAVRTMKLLLIKNECASNPCQNGGSCLDIYNGFICQCPNGWEGETCGKDVNECARFIGTDLGCQNGGTCINSPGSYHCQCPAGWTGVHCNRKPTDCSSGGFELCGHGTCISQNNQAGYKCLCDAGWTNENPQGPCTTDVNECAQNHPPCSTNPLVQCINVPGSYTCQHCPPGYTGNGYYCADINECEMFNGGCSVSPFVECLNTFGSSKCGPCPTGYEGDGKSCTYKGVCHINNGGCSVLARCVNNQAISAAYVECICPHGYTGNGIGPRGCLPGPTIDCSSKPCVHGRCISDNSTSGFRCLCDPGFVGDLCQTSNNLCDSNPCLNGGTCSLTNSRLMGYTCTCAPGFTGMFCANELSACFNTFVSENGTLSYPSKDFQSRRFESVYTCSWTIVTDKSKILEVTFSKFRFSNPPCMQEYLEINDGVSHLSGSLGRFCGSNLPLNGSFSTTQNYLNLLLVTSRASGDNPEFELSWKSKSLECGGSLSSNTAGLIRSPGWPEKYPNKRDCYWTYTLAPDKRMLFHVYALNFDTNSNCLDDYLEFYMKKTPTFIDSKLNIAEGDQLLLKLCNSTIPQPFYSLTSSGVIHFKSNHKDSRSGFQIGYSIENAIPGCGGIYTNPESYIQSPELTDSIPNPLICEYLIKLPKLSTIYIEVLSIGLEEDCSTNIEIYVESSTSELLARRCGSVIPAPFSVYGSTVIIKSTSKPHAENLWKIKYRSVCQELLTDQSGSISIDRERNGCRYLIQQPEGWIIMVDLMAFNSFYLKFINAYDGDNENAPQLVEFGSAGKYRIESTTNYLLLVVKKPVLDIHIEVNYTSINIGCGGLLKNKIGSIAYPSRNEEKYGPNAKCRWIIMSPPDTVIQLTFLTFHVEQSFDCSYDNLKIFDNNTDIGTGALIGTFCGYRLPPTILSSSNIITIDFTSDNSIAGDGFLISYNQIKESNVCGGNYFTPFGVVKSPGFPNEYPSNRECTWTITVDPGQQIMLKVLNFSLEAGEGYSMKSSSICRYDWLEVRNGGSSTSPLVGKYCGETIPKLIPSHANQIFLKFNSDLSRSSTGFMIEWDSATTGCGGSMVSPTGFIMSPQYPEPYPKKADCLWKIVVNVGSIIRATFSDVDLEAHSTCMLDYIELLDGLKFGSKSLGKFCTLPPDPVSSSSNTMLIRFRSDISIQGRGFQMNYMAVCNNRLTGFGGSIESPNFPNEYPQNQNCTWDIVVTKGNKINISFSDFDMESSSNNSETCTFDWVEILYKVSDNPYDEDYELADWTTYKRYCGYENPGLIALNSSVARVRFVSDSILKGSGFRLEWRLNGCGGILQADDNPEILQSPNYPKPYPMQVQCNWVIQSRFGQSVKIKFTDITVERDLSCSFDYVEIFNGPDDTYPIMGKFCHQLKSIVLTSTGKDMFVRFNSDFSYQGRGFIATYFAVPSSCGGEFTAPSGYIYSPNYPKNFNRNSTCEYVIDTDKNQLIELKFEDVDLIKKSNCSTNYIKVYDGRGYDDPVLKTICGNTTDFNETIRSNSETLMIEFRSDYHFTSKGFKAHYERACGRQLKVPESGSDVIDCRAEFFSDYDEFDGARDNICSYTLEAENPNDHIHLTITKMSKPDGFWCESNTSVVIIRNGKLSDSPILGEYCTSKLPTPLISDGSAMKIEIYNPLNFMATYSVLDTECGGKLKSSEGYLASPGWPNSYPNATECTWTISAGFGNTINLNFLNFDIPFSEKCNLDYLEVRENDSVGKLIGVFCGNDPLSNVSAIGTMVLIFKSSSDATANTPQKGFYVEYSVSNSNKLYGSEGYISKGVSDVQYLMRDWLITTNTETVIELTFEDLFLDPYDSDGDCEFGNAIKIYDGASNEAPILKEVCTSETPGSILSSSNMMFIQLIFFRDKNEAEVLMKWKELPKRSANSTSANKICGYLYDMESQNETLVNLTSPGYPTGYAPSLNCEWIYTTPSKYHLAFKLTDINLGLSSFFIDCKFTDKVSIYTRSSAESQWKLLRNFCGSTGSTEEIHGSNQMKVVFTTNKYLNGTGFQAIVRKACGGSMFDVSGEIELDSNNVHDNECQWNITVKPGRTIKLITQDFNLGHKNDGCKNYLMIRNGKFPDSPLLGKGKFCGSDSPNELESISNHLYIKYSGIDNVGHFRIKYKEVSVNCGGDIMLSISNPYEVITSPNYPNVPQPHSECIWIIRAPNGEAVIINFEENFDISTSDDQLCENEYVELRDGGTEISPFIGRYCQDMPNPKVTTGNLLRVKYFTNSDEQRNGFKANVSIAECGGTLTKSGHILSREHQLKIGSECVWWIKASYKNAINVNVVSLNVGKARRNCTAGSENGYLLLYEVGDEESVMNGTDTRPLANLCGHVKNTEFQSTTKLLKVVFKKNSNDDEFALQFTFNSAVCPSEDFTGDTGTITSFGYPAIIRQPYYCEWTINVKEDRRITFKIEDADIASVSKFSLLDGGYESVTIAEKTDIQSGAMYETSSNQAKIIFWQESVREVGKFKLTYTSDEPTLCVYKFEETSGQIISPNITRPFICTYVFGPSLENRTLVLDMTVHINKTKGLRCSVTDPGLYLLSKDGFEKICKSRKNFIYRIPRGNFFIRGKQEESENKLNYTVKYKTYNCGGRIFHKANGFISSPNFPKTPEQSMECAWLIELTSDRTYPSNSKIYLNFTVFDLEDDCERNYIEIYNGKSSNHPKIGKYCKNQVPGTIISQEDTIFLEYKYEYKKEDISRGFSLNFKEHSQSCGGLYQTEFSSISSPGYGNKNYDNNQECIWEIQAEEGHMIELEFAIRFFIEDSVNCSKDYIEVFDLELNTWKSLGKMCGRNTPKKILSSNKQLKIIFRSDNNVTGAGFYAISRWKCGGLFEATKQAKYLRSPNYHTQKWYSFSKGSYNCSYTIVTKNPQGFIKIIVKDIQNPLDGDYSCSHMKLSMKALYVKIPYLAIDRVICRSTNIGFTTRYKKGLVLNYITDNSDSGFEIMYSDDTCGGQITKPSTIEMSSQQITKSYKPGIPGSMRMSCTWTITAPKDQIVVFSIHKLNMTLAFKCLIQAVTVYDGSAPNWAKRLASLCGMIEESKPIPSTSNSMLIVLESFPQRFQGLKAEVYFTYGPSVGCGGTINLTETMYIQSPKDLPHMDCHWTIIAPRDYKVQLEFTDINIPLGCVNPVRNHTYYCTCTYIEARDGAGPFSEQMVKLCSSDNNSKRTLKTSWNTAYVRLYSAVAQNASSKNIFRLKLTPMQSECGRSILITSNEMQELTSPGYPNGYPEEIKCQWKIKSPDKYFSKFFIHFEDFNLQHTGKGNCDSDRLEISEDSSHQLAQEGFGPRAIENSQSQYFRESHIYEFCGNDTLPFDYYSSGYYIFLTFRSVPHSGKKGRGFKLKYGISGCNRTIHANEGVITSDSYNNNTNCVITIIADANRTISMFFKKFFFAFTVGTDCGNLGLEIREGRNLTGKQLLKACGYLLPNPVFSDTNVVSLRAYAQPNPLYQYSLIFTSSSNGKGCGGKLFNYLGLFTSPMYPNIYKEDIKCTWDIHVPKGYKVALKFKDFNIGSDCAKSKVVVTTYSTGGKNDLTYCRGDKPTILYSDNTMNVTYYSSVNNDGIGWLAIFTAILKENDQLAERIINSTPIGWARRYNSWKLK